MSHYVVGKNGRLCFTTTPEEDVVVVAGPFDAQADAVHAAIVHEETQAGICYRLESRFPERLREAGLTPVGPVTKLVHSGPVHRGPCACSCCTAFYEGRQKDFPRQYWTSAEVLPAARARELACGMSLVRAQ